MKSQQYRPSTTDEWTQSADPYVTVRNSARNSRSLPLGYRFQRFGPGLVFQFFALPKFLFTLYLIMNRPWTPIEVPIALMFLAIDAIFLISATFQDFFTLAVSWIISFFLLVTYILLLIFGPILVEHVLLPSEHDVFHRMRQRQKEMHFFKGFEFGMSFAMLLILLIAVSAMQLGLVNATLNAKIEECTRKKQVAEKRNSVYVV
ncbi:unnamed protein product [Caenorhabditis sp. 36 PRJEB53466]|nr:unnamed protein product [Caenorhabditis sp. 36 PRJEB53466]